MDAVGFEKAALLGVSEGGPASIVFAATRPERIRALILTGTLRTSLWISINCAACDPTSPAKPTTAPWLYTI